MTLSNQITSDFFGATGISKGAGVVSNLENEYIDTSRGALHLDYTDMSIPGNGGFELKIKRFYNSSRNSSSYSTTSKIFGVQGWQLGFGSATLRKVCTTQRFPTG
jgi:hypothetical protein